MAHFLRNVPLLADLPDTDLARIESAVREVRIADGDVLFREGDPGDVAYLIRDGELEVLKASDGREVLLAVRSAGDVIGELSLLEQTPRMATVRARKEATLLAVSQAAFEQLLDTSPAATRALLYTVLARWRSTEAMLHQNEKLVQLGQLSAGLAHELNNPAAAVRRGADQIASALPELQAAQFELLRLGPGPEAIAGLAAEVERLRGAARAPVELDAVARADREERLEEWLDGQGIDRAWELAPVLAGMGYDPDELARVAGAPGELPLAAVTRYLGAIFTVYRVLDEVGQGAARMSELVKALKTYSYLDRAPVQEVDVHEGLDSTLVLLRSRLKEGVEVRRSYAPDLPRILAYGSELNQVWTNLIDNAIDAMEGRGILEIASRHDGDAVVVQIRDDGPGIPDAIRPKIFTAFFTTKPPGKGTGLGLEICYNIVVGRHRGLIEVASQPGNTTFTVRLPLDFEHSGTTVGAAWRRLDDAELRRILEETRTIAVVGATDRPGRPSNTVPSYLQRQGYEIQPVNPACAEILGKRAFADLAAVPEPIDVVLVFRRADEAPALAETAIAKHVRVLWLQEGIVSVPAAQRAREAGLQVVMDTCMCATHRRLIAGQND